MLFRSAALFASAIWFGISSSQTCWGPDKKTVFTDVPCTNSTTGSACCSADGYCLSNGLCLTNMVIGRGSCTNWSSPACPQYCLDENPSGGQALSPCESTPTALFSCGLNNCATSNFSIGTDGVEIVLRSDQIAGLGLVPAASSSSASAAAESSGATSNSSLCTSSSNSPTAQQDTDDKKLIGVGVGLGVPLGLALIAALTLLGIEKRKNNQYRAASTQMHQQQLPWYDFLNKPSRLPMAEMGTNEAVSELPSRDSAPALPIKRDHTSFFDG